MGGGNPSPCPTAWKIIAPAFALVPLLLPGRARLGGPGKEQAPRPTARVGTEGAFSMREAPGRQQSPEKRKGGPLTTQVLVNRCGRPVRGTFARRSHFIFCPTSLQVSLLFQRWHMAVFLGPLLVCVSSTGPVFQPLVLLFLSRPLHCCSFLATWRFREAVSRDVEARFPRRLPWLAQKPQAGLPQGSPSHAGN